MNRNHKNSNANINPNADSNIDIVYMPFMWLIIVLLRECPPCLSVSIERCANECIIYVEFSVWSQQMYTFI